MQWWIQNLWKRGSWPSKLRAKRAENLITPSFTRDTPIFVQGIVASLALTVTVEI